MNSEKIMTIGNVTFTPYQQKPFDIWLEEKANEGRSEKSGRHEIMEP